MRRPSFPLSLLARAGTILWILALPMCTAAAEEIERLSCSGVVSHFSGHVKFPATVRDLHLEFDFGNGVVRGFGVPLTIVSSWWDLVQVAGSYWEPVGLVRVTGNIERWTGKAQLRAMRGDREGGLLVSLWQLDCDRMS
jgi:hypothetical protein